MYDTTPFSLKKCTMILRRKKVCDAWTRSIATACLRGLRHRCQPAVTLSGALFRASPSEFPRRCQLRFGPAVAAHSKGQPMHIGTPGSPGTAPTRRKDSIYTRRKKILFGLRLPTRVPVPVTLTYTNYTTYKLHEHIRNKFHPHRLRSKKLGEKVEENVTWWRHRWPAPFHVWIQ